MSPISKLGHDPVQVPTWCQVTYMLCVVLSWVVTYEVGHRYFTYGDTTHYGMALIPGVFFLAGAECVLIRLSGLRSTAAQYSFDDLWASLVSGACADLIGTCVMRNRLFSGLSLHVWLHGRWGVGSFAMDPHSYVTWIVAFILVDLHSYAFHRFHHELSAGWAAHIVHHSSDRMNIVTATRQPMALHLYQAFALTVLLPIFPSTVMYTVQSWNVILQIWYHTCVVRRLGCLENVLATPSNHRVHHDRRVHKNFGAVFIVWDRLFGTFLDELAHGDATAHENDETCYFGVRHPYETWTHAVTQHREWVSLVLRGNYWRGPGYVTSRVPRTLAPYTVGVERIRLRWAPRCRVAYVFMAANVLFVAGLTLYFLAVPSRLIPYGSWLFSNVAMLFVTYVAQGLILDGLRVGLWLEGVRCVAVVVMYVVGSSAYLVPHEYQLWICAWHVATLLVLVAQSEGILSDHPREGRNPTRQKDNYFSILMNGKKAPLYYLI